MNIENLQQSLLSKRQQLLQRIEAVENDFKKGRSANFAEQGIESENNEVLDVIESEAKIELKQINEALQRIENQQYGQCAVCDEPIASKRLAALPYVTTCIECAQ